MFSCLWTECLRLVEKWCGRGQKREAIKTAGDCGGVFGMSKGKTPLHHLCLLNDMNGWRTDHDGTCIVQRQRLIFQERRMTQNTESAFLKKSKTFTPKANRGKNTWVIPDSVPLIQPLLTISNSEAILHHSEWAYVWHWILENFRLTNQCHITLLYLALWMW